MHPRKRKEAVNKAGRYKGTAKPQAVSTPSGVTVPARNVNIGIGTRPGIGISGTSGIGIGKTSGIGISGVSGIGLGTTSGIGIGSTYRAL
jgi:hypothetical protein